MYDTFVGTTSFSMSTMGNGNMENSTMEKEDCTTELTMEMTSTT